jgi:hypothetical protein
MRPLTVKVASRFIRVKSLSQTFGASGSGRRLHGSGFSFLSERGKQLWRLSA